MNRQRALQFVMGLAALGFVGVIVPAQAQVTPFQIVGHIENFVLDSTVCPTVPPEPPVPAEFIGARMTVNGISVVIPCHTVILMPAAYFTPRQLFDRVPGVIPGANMNNSQLALEDATKPLAAFEVSIDGNIVGGRYIAGQVHISQQSLNSGAGFIKSINYDTGELRIGADPATPVTNADARVHINDPETDILDANGEKAGRYGLSNKQQFRTAPANARFPDSRFQVDQGNPTIHALTGYPMCVPRFDPAIKNDPQCPAKNRLAGQSTFVMDTVPFQPPAAFGAQPILPCQDCDSGQQAPFMVGDYVTYAGTLAEDNGARFVSVHTMVGNVGIYTKPGSRAYVTLDESLIGTKGNIVSCGSIAECQDRIKIEGFSTDPNPNRTVNIYAIDVVPGGAATARKLSSTAKVQAVLGRFRYVTGKNAGVLFDSGGSLKGATRELMARIDDGSPFPDGSPVPDPPNSPKIANGLSPGIYVAPVGEYIFPEPTGVQGGGLPALNFQCLAFLVNGWALPPDLTDIKRLDPWPGAPSPIFSCSN
jgi:hypothetical protein